LPQPSAGGNDQSGEYVPPVQNYRSGGKNVAFYFAGGNNRHPDDLFGMAPIHCPRAFLNQVREEMGLTINIRNVFIEPPSRPSPAK